jgi:hypothetical protein
MMESYINRISPHPSCLLSLNRKQSEWLKSDLGYEKLDIESINEAIRKRTGVGNENSSLFS